MIALGLVSLLMTVGCGTNSAPNCQLAKEFKTPPVTARPGVYWYFMDGNLSREGMTKDLESMKAAGIASAIFLEVGIGVPRGPVDFMSEEWQELFVHAVREAERLGIRIVMGAGPGWCGSGGPWVPAEESMQHLVFSEIELGGGRKHTVTLPVPEQRSTPWHTMKDPYYKDIAVLAVPRSAKPVIEDINEKALYERYPYSSWADGVKPFLPAPSDYVTLPEESTLDSDQILDISDNLSEDGVLAWDAPTGDWTVIRMGLRVTGASTRPSPQPVIGLESNKLDSEAFANHLSHYTDILLEKTAPRKEGVGWTGFHIDSWESGSQNWTDTIENEFRERRGYELAPYLAAYTGRAVGSLEISERFLWDLRKTCQELLLENHAEFAKEYAHKHGLELTIEPYDMNPAGDLDLGAVADVIMAEFWSRRHGFDTHYAVLEATSISHISGQPVVGAEVFTSDNSEAWQEYPWSMKDQGDWALAMGVNRFFYHTFAHKPLGDQHRPGMTMGPYGVHWDRGQTWWPMVSAYHGYISRCSHMMQQGQVVADILYLTPEGAPLVFTPPKDSLSPNGKIPDKKGYQFDACSPMMLDNAVVEDAKIVFPGAASYEIMVLPSFDTMTPELLKTIATLVEQGATIIGSPPHKSPSLSGYPDCDKKVESVAKVLWGADKAPSSVTAVSYGIGTIYWGGELSGLDPGKQLYPDYRLTAAILEEKGVRKDFSPADNSIRFGHRRTEGRDIYFLANRTAERRSVSCRFRAAGSVELWDGVSGNIRPLNNYKAENGMTTAELTFEPHESCFVVFDRTKNTHPGRKKGTPDFPTFQTVTAIDGPWELSFDPAFGGPEKVTFDTLTDWTDNADRGIRYYSGIGTYTKTFTLADTGDSLFLDLGTVHDIARVSLNGHELGVVWCAPWRIDISSAASKGKNTLVIEVANRWVNRLRGDMEPPDAGVRKVTFDDGLMEGREYTTGRYTFTPDMAVNQLPTEPLPSGLIGPVTIQRAE